MNPRETGNGQQACEQGQMQAAQLTQSCPMCGEDCVSTTWVLHAFDYGSEEDRVELHVRVPMNRCGACEFEYLDYRAERLKHDAVCDYLGVLSPDEIRRIRENYSMTRAAFADVTGLGEASLNRWENGLSIQRLAHDRYLRLLMASRLSEDRVLGADAKRFRCLEVTEFIKMEQEAFSLHRAA